MGNVSVSNAKRGTSDEDFDIIFASESRRLDMVSDPEVCNGAAFVELSLPDTLLRRDCDRDGDKTGEVTRAVCSIEDRFHPPEFLRSPSIDVLATDCPLSTSPLFEIVSPPPLLPSLDLEVAGSLSLVLRFFFSFLTDLPRTVDALSSKVRSSLKDT